MKYCLCLLMAFVLAPSQAMAGFVFSVLDTTVEQNLLGPTTGVFNVLVTPTGPDIGTQVISFTANVNLGGLSGGITAVNFGAPFDPVAFDLFPAAGSPVINNSHPIASPLFIVGTSDSGIAGPVTLTSTMGLFSVPFSVAQGEIGSFTVNFTTPAQDPFYLNAIADSNFNEITPTVQSGTVTITAVPEPSSLLLIAGVAGGIAARRRFRAAKK